MFALPTLKDLAERARQSFRTNLPGSDAWIWPNNVYASAKVIAGAVFEVFGFAAYIQKQMFAHTAPDIDSLLLHGEEYGIARKPAVPAQGKATFTATTALSVAPDAVLRRSDNVEYLVPAGGVLSEAGTLELDIVAIANGTDGNAVEGTPLDIISGVTGDATAEIGGGDVTLGADEEPMEQYRARILFRKRNPPHGGSAADYVLWAGQVTGVTDVYVERLWAGVGTVRVVPLMWDLYANGIPSATDIERVEQYIETVRPAGALVTVAPPVAVPVNITIDGLSPDTTATREAVLDELRAAFRRLSRPAGADTAHPGMPYLMSEASFSRSWIWQAVANAAGEERHSITVPSADIALASGEMATLGTVSFT